MIQLETIIEKLNLLFSIDDYENAEKLIESARRVPELYNDTVAIYDANLAMNNNDYPRMWQAIKRGLEHNPKNYELYVMLGEYYVNSNPNQAYLCFENSLLYCNNEYDCTQILQFMETLKKEHNITVNNVSFIILSYNTLDYTKTCIKSIRENTLASSREIVVVDNASTDGSLEWLKKQQDIVLRANKENSGFPRGCNQGVEFAQKENDIFLLNNDTLLPPNALFWLRMGLYENDTIGTTGSITNYSSNLQSIQFEDPTIDNMLAYALKNNLPTQFPYEEKLYLVGFALLIKRSVYNKVGDLDERFSPGNYEDNDYGLRVLQAGYKNILCHNSFILHFGSKSFGKKTNSFKDILSVNRTKFEEKWNISADYLYPRVDLIHAIKEEPDTYLNILIIGSKCGALCAYLKFQFHNAVIHTIENSTNAIRIAQPIVSTKRASIEEYEFSSDAETYDYILIEEDFENYKHPSKVLNKLKTQLKQDGRLILIALNIKHYSVLLPLIQNDAFSYTNAGILNPNHVKMYTQTELIKLVQQSGYTVENLQMTQTKIPNKHIEEFIDSLTALSPSVDKSTYLTLKYMLTAKKNVAPPEEKIKADAFLKQLQNALSANDIDKSIELLSNVYPKLEITTETQILYILYNIYQAEIRAGCTSIFHKHANIDELIEIFEHLKFYIRRFDFKVEDESTHFVKFIKEQKLSSHAIYFVILTSAIHKLDVQNQIAAILLENDELQMAQTLMNYHL